jgi:uncharacterized protein YdhG (YjbR/CyaY superfamily)
MAKDPKPINFDDYISRFPENIQRILEELRQRIRSVAPEAQEVISYGIPAFKQKGILVYFGAWQNHIGFYPPVSGDPELESDARPFAGPKGNLQFPINETIPYELVERIVRHRVFLESSKKRKKKEI